MTTILMTGRRQGRSEAARNAAAVTMLQAEHIELVRAGYRLRTIRTELRPKTPGQVSVKLTWCRRRNPSKTIKHTARLTESAHEFLLGWLMAPTDGA